MKNYTGVWSRGNQEIKEFYEETCHFIYVQLAY